MNIINGKQIAKKIKLKLRKKIVDEKIEPALAAILIGNNPASEIYLKLKEKECKKVGINFHKYYFEDDMSEKKILAAIDFLNKDNSINGILVQLPLPKKFNTKKIINKILPLKDADGFHQENLKNFWKNKAKIWPVLSKCISLIINYTEENIKNKTCIIISNSKTFAEPVIKYFQTKEVKAEWISPSDKNLNKKTKTADILIVAVGKKKFIKKSIIKDDSIIIDIGINKNKDGSVCGDVDFKNIKNKAKFITPVPGGVGPITIAVLLKNVVKLYEMQNK